MRKKCLSCGNKNMIDLMIVNDISLVLCTECTLVQQKTEWANENVSTNLDELSNPHDYLAAVGSDTFTLTLPYLGSIIQGTDTTHIKPERVSYYSLASLEYLLARHGYKITEVEIAKNGTFKVVVSKMNSVEQQRLIEGKLKLGNKWTYLLYGMKLRGRKDGI